MYATPVIFGTFTGTAAVAIIVTVVVYLLYVHDKSTLYPPSRYIEGYTPDQTFSNTDIGAVFYCYKNRRATERVLKKFRQWYPDPNNSQIALLVDGGIEFDYLITPMGITWYEYGSILQWVLNTQETAIEWFKRLNKGIQNIHNKWVMILEDDVELLSRLQYKPQAHVWGGNTGSLLLTLSTSTFIRKERRKKGVKDNNTATSWMGLKYGYSCCGGVVIDADFWRENYVQQDVEKFIHALFNYMPDPNNIIRKIVHSDLAMSSLFLWWGGDILPSDEWAEPKFSVSDRPISVLHDFKQEYDLETKKQPHHIAK